MKVGGVQVTNPPEEILVIPRGDEEIVFRAKAIQWDDFLSTCPDPEPPMVLGKGGEKTANIKDATYLHQVEQQAKRRVAYMVVRSLEPSQIEWDHVDIEDPKTWLGFEDELIKSGFVPIEVNRIIQLCMDANQLDEQKLAKAREAFLRGRAGA